MKILFYSIILSFGLTLQASDQKEDLNKAIGDLTLAIKKYKDGLNKKNKPKILKKEKAVQKIEKKIDEKLKEKIEEIDIKPTNFFEIKKEHRILDTIARLLAEELSNDINSPSYSVAWVKNRLGKTALAVAINEKKYLNKGNLVKALRNIRKDSFLLANSTRGDLNKFIKEKVLVLNELIKKIEKTKNKYKFRRLEKEYHLIRKDVDLIKLFQSTLPKGKKYNPKVAKFLNNINKDNCLLLDSYDSIIHSELSVVRYILETNSYFGYIKNSRNEDIPYQYIGSSKKSCAKCVSLINGKNDLIGINNLTDKTHMAIFLRGYNPYAYPGKYFIPGWSKRINNKSEKWIKKQLKDLPWINKLNIGQKFVSKTESLSQSDDEQ